MEQLDNCNPVKPWKGLGAETTHTIPGGVVLTHGELMTNVSSGGWEDSVVDILFNGKDLASQILVDPEESKQVRGSGVRGSGVRAGKMGMPDSYDGVDWTSCFSGLWPVSQDQAKTLYNHTLKAKLINSTYLNEEDGLLLTEKQIRDVHMDRMRSSDEELFDKFVRNSAASNTARVWFKKSKLARQRRALDYEEVGDDGVVVSKPETESDAALAEQERWGAHADQSGYAHVKYWVERQYRENPVMLQKNARNFRWIEIRAKEYQTGIYRDSVDIADDNHWKNQERSHKLDREFATDAVTYASLLTTSLLGERDRALSDSQFLDPHVAVLRQIEIERNRILKGGTRPLSNAYVGAIVGGETILKEHEIAWLKKGACSRFDIHERATNAIKESIISWGDTPQMRLLADHVPVFIYQIMKTSSGLKGESVRRSIRGSPRGEKEVSAELIAARQHVEQLRMDDGASYEISDGAAYRSLAAEGSDKEYEPDEDDWCGVPDGEERLRVVVNLINVAMPHIFKVAEGSIYGQWTAASFPVLEVLQKLRPGPGSGLLNELLDRDVSTILAYSPLDEMINILNRMETPQITRTMPTNTQYERYGQELKFASDITQTMQSAPGRRYGDWRLEDESERKKEEEVLKNWEGKIVQLFLLQAGGAASFRSRSTDQVHILTSELSILADLREIELHRNGYMGYRDDKDIEGLKRAMDAFAEVGDKSYDEAYLAAREEYRLAELMPICVNQATPISELDEGDFLADRKRYGKGNNTPAQGDDHDSICSQQSMLCWCPDEDCPPHAGDCGERQYKGNSLTKGEISMKAALGDRIRLLNKGFRMKRRMCDVNLAISMTELPYETLLNSEIMNRPSLDPSKRGARFSEVASALKVAAEHRKVAPASMKGEVTRDGRLDRGPMPQGPHIGEDGKNYWTYKMPKDDGFGSSSASGDPEKPSMHTTPAEEGMFRFEFEVPEGLGPGMSVKLDEESGKILIKPGHSATSMDPTRFAGGGRTKKSKRTNKKHADKPNKRKTNKRKTNKRKTKRKTNKRKTNKRKTKTHTRRR